MLRPECTWIEKKYILYAIVQYVNKVICWFHWPICLLRRYDLTIFVSRFRQRKHTSHTRIDVKFSYRCIIHAGNVNYCMQPSPLSRLPAETPWTRQAYTIDLELKTTSKLLEKEIILSSFNKLVDFFIVAWQRQTRIDYCSINTF